MFELMTISPVGDSGPDEAVFDKAGSHIFKVPAGVTRISGVFIGPGAGSGGSQRVNAYSGGGGGGAMFWFNDLPVTPGEEFIINIGSPGAGGTEAGGRGVSGGVVSFTRGTTKEVELRGGSGGVGTADYPNMLPGTGGSGTIYQGSIYANGTSKFSLSDGKQGVMGGSGSGSQTGAGGKAGGYNPNRQEKGNSLYGTAGKNPIYGGGGDGVCAVSGGPVVKGNAGQGGAARIIWGPGRSFPNNAG